MPLPDNAPDTRAKLNERGLYHYVSKGEKTTACGIPAQHAVTGMRAEVVDKMPDYDRPKRCFTCLQAARKEGHK